MKVFQSNTRAFDTSSIYDSGEDMLQSKINASKVLQPDERITVPTGSSGVTKSLAGLTARHVLVQWNFYTAASNGSMIPENSPPADMEWSTGSEAFTLKIVGPNSVYSQGGSSSVYCRPVFALPTQAEAYVSGGGV